MSHFPKYMPHLDALRAFAVISVAYSHWIPVKYHFNIPWGSVGVQLFFVLSGYLITGILINALQQKMDEQTTKLYVVRNFIARRALRIFPAYYMLLIIVYMWGLRPFPESIQWHTFYMSNFYFFFRQEWAGPASHFWSLAVEEQFYLVWPWLVIFFTGTLLRVSWLIVFTSVAILIVVKSLDPSLRMLGVMPLPAFLALALGSILVIYKNKSHHHLPILLRFCTVGGVVFILTSMIAASSIWSHPLLPTVNKIAMILTFVWVVEKGSLGFSGVFGRICSNRIILKLGTISYGLYLIHNITPKFISSLYRAEIIPKELYFGIGGLLLKAAVTVIFALFSWHFLEAPMNRLKVHFPYTKIQN